MSTPVVRARHLKSVLAAVDRERRAHDIRRATGDLVVARIEAASGMDWLPVEHDVALANGLHAVLGAAGHAAFNEAMMAESYRGPLLGTLVQTAFLVIGNDPARWARWIPKGWSLAFRDCGEWRVEPRTPFELALTLSGMAPACARDAVWPGSVGSSLGALMHVAGVDGSIALERIDPEARTAVYAARWRSPT